MSYFLETELNQNKSIYYSLKQIYGINIPLAKLLCKKMGFCLNLKTKSLDSKQKELLLALINSSNIKINNDLKTSQTLNLKRLISIKAYKGLRRLQGFPVRGQRTHTNAKSAKKRKF